MTNITATMVKELRDSTGAGMLDAKKALVETNGDMEAAVDWLRTKGLATAAKKASRVAAEGLVAIAVEGNKGAVVEVNSETDFVAKNELFQEYVCDAAKVALKCDGCVNSMGEFACPKTKKSFKERLTDLIAKIGENMNIRRAKSIEVKDGVIASYTHNAAAPNVGKIGVLVALESTGNKDKLAELGKTIAMHIAASAPQFKTIAEVAPESVEREKAIFTEQAAASGKPANIIEKMVEGRIRKYYDEVVLEEQMFIMDTEKKVKQVIKEAEKEVGAPVELKEFVMFKLGEGIEKRTEDFAAEVAAQLGK
ncbi:MAG: translation elongation factor Ts [Lactobacillaceae bacterium]|jgi:elongation factor Ts|nr:translation elongation factor Ts [Lactobacillaceae bacterium]